MSSNPISLPKKVASARYLHRARSQHCSQSAPHTFACIWYLCSLVLEIGEALTEYLNPAAGPHSRWTGAGVEKVCHANSYTPSCQGETQFKTNFKLDTTLQVLTTGGAKVNPYWPQGMSLSGNQHPRVLSATCTIQIDSPLADCLKQSTFTQANLVFQSKCPLIQRG